jgi:hypothetical protein
MLRLIFTAVFAFVFAITAGAQVLAPADDLQPGLQVNGCGAKDGIKVPDKLVGCELKAACNNHDLCYAKCLPGGQYFTAPHCQYMRCQKGGDLARTPLCQGDSFKALAVEARARRAKCDQGLLTEIKHTNKTNPMCGAVAGAYYTAVVRAGGGHFNGYEVQEVMKAVDKLTTDKSKGELAQLEHQGFDGKAPLLNELKLASKPSNAHQQQKHVLTNPPVLDSQKLRNQMLRDKVIGPGSGAGAGK